MPTPGRMPGPLGGPTGRWPLVGRDDELALLHGELAAGVRSVVLAGAIGVGKSRLWSTWLSGLEAQGLPTVVVRATASTSTLRFGAFARWVPGGMGGAGDSLAVLQAAAARLAGGSEAPIVAVDDAHQLDYGSAALLLHLVEHTRADVVVTVRSGEPCPDAVTALWKEGHRPPRPGRPPQPGRRTVEGAATERLVRDLGDPARRAAGPEPGGR